MVVAQLIAVTMAQLTFLSFATSNRGRISWNGHTCRIHSNEARGLSPAVLGFYRIEEDNCPDGTCTLPPNILLGCHLGFQCFLLGWLGFLFCLVAFIFLSARDSALLSLHQSRQPASPPHTWPVFQPYSDLSAIPINFCLTVITFSSLKTQWPSPQLVGSHSMPLSRTRSYHEPPHWNYVASHCLNSMPLVSRILFTNLSSAASRSAESSRFVSIYPS